MSEIIWNEHIVERTLNGEKVRFKCKYWSKDIYVEMIEPYQGENESLHTFDVWEEIGGNGSQWAAVVSKKVI